MKTLDPAVKADMDLISDQQWIIYGARRALRHGNIAQRSWARLIIMEAKWQIRRVKERNE